MLYTMIVMERARKNHNEIHLWDQLGALFSIKAAMPSFWSSVAKRAWNVLLSNRRPSSRFNSYAALTVSFAIATTKEIDRKREIVRERERMAIRLQWLVLEWLSDCNGSCYITVTECDIIICCILSFNQSVSQSNSSTWWSWKSWNLTGHSNSSIYQL